MIRTVVMKLDEGNFRLADSKVALTTRRNIVPRYDLDYIMLRFESWRFMTLTLALTLEIFSSDLWGPGRSLDF